MSEIAKLPNQNMSQTMEAVLIEGDLSKLTSEQRVIYYKKTCESLGLNYLTKPFAYIKLNGKLTFYALKDCTEQLRKRDGVSIYEIKTTMFDGVYVVTAYARTREGKEDVATGAVPTLNLKGEALANALMKAETKAKRRVTLSICGLGMTDEEEINSIPTALKVDVNLETGEIESPTSLTVEYAPRTDEEILRELAPIRQELIDGVLLANDMDDLKGAYARAYVCHAKRTDIMKDITDLKDQRKAELEKHNDQSV